MQISREATGTEVEASGPLYARLAADLRRQIQGGLFRPGDRLPSVRALRRERRVSVATVVEAYLALEAEGWVTARERSGFFAASPARAATPPPEAQRRLLPPAIVDVSEVAIQVLRRSSDRGLVPLGCASLHPSLLPVARVNRALRRAAAREPLHGAVYDSVEGCVELRRQIARHASLGGVACDPEDLVITSGGLEAVNIALRAVARPGDVVAVESPTYFGILQAVEWLGARAVEVPADPVEGIRLDLLEQVLRRHRPKAVVCMPTCHNPHGSVMTDVAKAALVELVARHDVALVEDDVYGELAHREPRPRTAKSFDRTGHVLLCSSFSKVIAPGLRVGWVDAGRYRARVEVVKSVTSLVTARLPQLALAETLDGGFYERYTRRLRGLLAGQVARYAEAVAASFPDGTRMTRPAGGNLLWVQLPGGADGSAVWRGALAAGIGVMPGEIFSPGGRHRSFVRLSCGAPLDPEIEDAIGVVGRLAAEAVRAAS
jgi:DNA-binding transcriptional MocR family regulator